MATNGTFANQDQLKGNGEPAPAPTTAEPTSSSTSSNLSKDEVGWYFVEQYYTTLSKTPEKLHLFYGKRSQFVYGKEAEVTSISVGRSAIQERIKELDFQDCKVRVTNVDSMASFDNIVIQVLGETSNRSGEPQKFAQTFVLAPQPSGYFVVNDILRFITEEGEEEAAPETSAESAPAESAPTAESAVKTAGEAPEKGPEAQVEAQVEAVDKKPEEVTAAEVAPSNGKSAEPAPEATKAEAAPETQTEAATTSAPETAAREVAEESAKEPEKPAESKPAPAVPAQAAEKPTPAPAPVPAKPMSWASRAAAAVGPKPVVALPKTATPPAQAKAPAPAPAPAPATAPVPTPAQQPAAQTQQQAAEPKESSQNDAEWQSVTDSKRQNRPQSMAASAENPGTLGYVKYVTEKVKSEDLRAALASHGELTYFDINRAKNCAFVAFATPAGYQAAVAANPHVVNGENIVVEPRRLKAGGYAGGNYAGRGGASNRGRGGYDGQRSGSQGGGRGGFAGGQGRGRGAPRGRGGAQATNA